MRFLTYQELVSKSLRERLCDNPNKVLDIDKSVEVIIKKDTKNKMHFVLDSFGIIQQDLATVNAADSLGASTASSAITVSSIGSVSSTVGSVGTLSTFGSVTNIRGTPTDPR